MKSIKILDKNGLVVQNFKKNWKVEIIIEELAYDPTAYSTVSSLSSSLQSNKNIGLSWSPIPQPGWFEVEWVYIDNLTTTAGTPDEYFKRGATRAITSSPQFTVTNHYALQGTLHYRVRGVRPLYLSPSNSISPYINEYTPWVNGSQALGASDVVVSDSYSSLYQVNYSESGKRLETMNYFDGKGMMRQSIVKPNDYVDTVIASESFYNYAGAGAIQTLPVPIVSSDLSYQPDLNVFTGQSANAVTYYDEIGDIPPSMTSSSGSNQYYSSSNNIYSNWKRSLIPEANGYAYSYTEYDSEGRVRYQNVPGETFKVDNTLTSPRFTKHEYVIPDKGHLYALLGSNSGLVDQYTVQRIKDPNGQVTKNYMDAKVLTNIESRNP